MQLPLFQIPSSWQPPDLASLPDWRHAKRVAIDTETCDPKLHILGPGVRRGGYIAGVSIAIEDGPSFYLPIAHLGGDNMPKDAVLSYVRDNAKEFNGDLCGANLGYELDYFAEIGIEFPRVRWFRDVQNADPLINELYNEYDLDSIASRWGLPGKDERLLREAAYGHGLDPKKDLYKLPARYVGAYATQDAVLPLQILRRQEREIEAQDLWNVYNLESKVLPVVVRMRRRGVKIDEDHLEQVYQWSLKAESDALEQVRLATGHRIPVGAMNQKKMVAPVLQAIGVRLKATENGQFEIRQELFHSINHPVAKHLLMAKNMDKLRGTFIKGLRDHIVNGRIHCTFNQMRRTREDDEPKGARFGRLSSSDPNLQYQPKRQAWGKMWRKNYIPDPGKIWLCADYSQQEPRMTTHYAELCGLPKAEEAASRYRNDPNMDNHQMMADMCGIPRDPAKIIYLGLCYGMGGAKLARSLGLPTKWATIGDRQREIAGDEAQRILDQFNTNAPFVRQLAYRCEEVAKTRGSIRTILGRVLHFPLKADKSGFDWAHKAISRLIQGSSADQTKQAMVEVDAAGYPIQLQVHDELDMSIDSVDEAHGVAEIMMSCVPLRVPSRVDLEVGPSWGELAGV